MVTAYVFFLIVSMLFYYVARTVIRSARLRFAIAATFFVVSSVGITVMISRGHRPPPGSRVVDLEEMARRRQALNASQQ